MIDDSEWKDANKIINYSSKTHDFYWNDDFTKFIPLPLKWWDDQSYIDYQSKS